MAHIVLPTEVGSIVAPPRENPEGFDPYVLGYDGQWYADEREAWKDSELPPGWSEWCPVPTEEVEEFVLRDGFRDIQLLSDVIPE